MKLDLGDVKITVSILGATAETHDKITQVKGSFEQAKQGILNLLGKKQNVNINFTIQNLNYHEIFDMCKFFIGKGVNTIQLAIVEPNGRAKNNFKEFVPKMSDLIPHITKALQFGNGNIKVKNIPKCLLGDYHELEFFPTANHQKTKVSKCKDCRFDQENRTFRDT